MIIDGRCDNMVHVEIEEWLYNDLCRLKPKVRSYNNKHGNGYVRKGKVSLQEVIAYIYFHDIIDLELHY